MFPVMDVVQESTLDDWNHWHWYTFEGGVDEIHRQRDATVSYINDTPRKRASKEVADAQGAHESRSCCVAQL